MRRIAQALLLVTASILGSTARAEMPILKAGISNYPPYGYMENGVAKGAAVEITNAVAKAAGYQVSYEIKPFARTLKDMATGKIDLKILIFEKPERAAYMHFLSTPSLFERYVLFRRKDGSMPSAPAIDDLPIFRIGAIRGKAVGPYFESLKLKLHLVSKEENMMKMLVKGRLDYILGDGAQLHHEATKLGLRSRIEVIPGHQHATPSYIAVSRQTPESAKVVGLLTTALVNFKQTAAYADILKRYGFLPNDF